MTWNHKTIQVIQQNFTSWLSLFTNLFQEFLKEVTYPYRLIEIKYCKEKEELNSILQFASKNLYFEISLQELVINTDIIQNLSPTDVRVITYYACMENMQPKLYIDSWSFSEERKEEIFTIKNHSTKQTMSKTASEITQEIAALKKFSSEDAHKIGFVQGTNSVFQEIKSIEEIKKMNSNTLHN